MTPEEVFTDWYDKEGIRFLNDDNSVPSIEQRVKHAFMAGLHHNYIRECVRVTMLRMSQQTQSDDRPKATE